MADSQIPLQFSPPDRKHIWSQINELYNCRPTEDRFANFRLDAQFKDPLSICLSLNEVKAQFYGMAKLFRGSETRAYHFIKDEPNTLWVNLSMVYDIPLMGKTPMNSIVVVDFDDAGKVVSMEDRWDGKRLATKDDGLVAWFKCLFRRANGKFLPYFVSFPRSL